MAVVKKDKSWKKPKDNSAFDFDQDSQQKLIHKFKHTFASIFAYGKCGPPLADLTRCHTDFFAMRNLGTGMTHPCVVDIKLGSKAYNPAKLERQRWKTEISTSALHGFRFCGVSYYARRAAGAEAEVVSLTKHKCRGLTID